MTGIGKIYQRKGRWWITYRFRGQEVRQSVARLLRIPPGAITEQMARRVLRDRMGEITAGLFVGTVSDRVTVAQLLDDYLAALKQRGARAWSTAEDRIAPLRAALGQHRPGDLTTPLLREYMEQRLAAGYAPATVSKGEMATLRAALRMARREERIGRLPAFPSLPVNNVRQGFLEPEQFEAIATRLPAHYQDAVRFAYLGARRIGEVVGLPWAWVDRASGEIRWPSTKNGRPLVMPLTGELAALIERRWKARAVGTVVSAWVFHVDGRGAMALSGLRRHWAKAAAAAGFPGMVPHDLRRSGIRNMIRAGVDKTVAKRISGHQSDTTFDRYNIVVTDDLRKALARVESYARTVLVKRMEHERA